MDFDTLEIQTPGGPRTALVITPVKDILVTPRHHLPQEMGMSESDRRILDGARDAISASASVCIFRARAPVGNGAYRFEQSMSDSEAVSTALAMLDGQLRVYREMLRLGICLFLHTDLDPIAVHGFRGAVDIRAEELETITFGVGPDAKSAQLDLWILRNLNFFFSLGFDKLIATILPDKLILMENRMERIRRLAHEVE
ncbi:MAG: hypothetical protein KUG77_29895 [Nannocystaceae bacterium]|nr:hypothetical protein [Nannocystaceae bacterium]